MEPVEIVPGIQWVGVLDPQLRVFDVVMRAEHGTTYNSYLVSGRDRIALVDANKGRYGREFVDIVRRAVDPARIDYLVLNHLEPDHSGAAAALLEAAPQARVVVTRPGKALLSQVLNRDVDPIVAADGDTLDLGGKTLRFLVAPYLHWPDTMFTYVPEDGALFPCDFLGAHYCDDRLFDDRVENYDYAFRYYFHVIMRPFKEHVRKGLAKLEGLPLNVVCPSHGPILRSSVDRCLARYREWSAEPPARDRKRLLVFYASAYGNTEKLAQAMVRGAEAAGAEAALFDLLGVDLHAILDDIELSNGIAVGSCTINGDALEHAWALLSSLATLKMKDKVGAAFGSYGWSGEGPKMLADRLRGLKLKVPEDPLRVQLVPTEADLAAAEEYGKRLAGAL
ncbi:MAG: FprA family A-type flavoprotein [Deltaproteobacteria bacterium]|nr:FprA family A-type flavoprotein [Deltaproteobacteria bacterium]